jgi:CBS-domain-containing membrane protein
MNRKAARRSGSGVARLIDVKAGYSVVNPCLPAAPASLAIAVRWISKRAKLHPSPGAAA